MRVFEYDFWWSLANKVRRACGRQSRVRRCCRKEANIGAAMYDSPDCTFRRCKVCGARHFTLTADPLKLILRGAAS